MSQSVCRSRSSELELECGAEMLGLISLWRQYPIWWCLLAIYSSHPHSCGDGGGRMGNSGAGFVRPLFRHYFRHAQRAFSRVNLRASFRASVCRRQFGRQGFYFMYYIMIVVLVATTRELREDKV